MRKTALIVWIALAAIQTGTAQSSRFSIQEKETIHKTLEFSGTANRTIELDNVFGSIHVSGTNDRAVEMTANKTIHAESRDRVAEAQRDVKLDITDRAETVRIYVDGPFRSNQNRRWSEPGYRVDFDFDLRVPQGTRLRLRTVNGGDVHVDGTTGDFQVENVNGGITMTDIRGSGSAVTVNGPVKVSFVENPKAASSFKSINGVIEVAFQPNLSADLQMKTFNGGLYTDFEVKTLPAVMASGERINGRYVYHSNQFTGVRVGSGGPEIKFDGFNGDVRVLRRTR